MGIKKGISGRYRENRRGIYGSQVTVMWDYQRQIFQCYVAACLGMFVAFVTWARYRGNGPARIGHTGGQLGAVTPVDDSVSCIFTLR